MDETLDTLASPREGARSEVVTGPALAMGVELARDDTVDRYVIRDKLGAGGMGTVYAAFDPQLGRKVALKLIRHQGTEARKRLLLREAQALAAVKHPNVVTVHEVGEAGDGQSYVVMELIEGPTLRAYLGQQQRSVDELRRVFAEAARGLHAAHERGLVHGDFKPDNVMLDARGRARVLDFGLARFDRELGVLDSAMLGKRPLFATGVATRSGAGTLAYMAPEQLRGDTRSSQLSDQFSFCVSLWEALHGARPFELNDVDDWRPQRGSSTQRVPKLVERAMLRGLSVEPGARFGSMEPLIEALEHQPRRGRWAAGLAAVGLAAALGYGAWSERAQAQARAEQVRACEALGHSLDELWSEQARAAGRTTFAATQLSYASITWSTIEADLSTWVGRWSTQRTRLCRMSELEGSWTAAEREASEDCFAMRRAELEAALARLTAADEDVVMGGLGVVSRLRDPDQCTDKLHLARQLAPPPELRERVLALRMQTIEAEIMTRVARYEDAQALGQQVLDEGEALGFAPLVAEALHVLASTTHLTGDNERARELHERAFELAGRSGHDLIAGRAAISLLAVMLNEERYELAEHWAKVGEIFFARVGLEVSFDQVQLLSNLGVVYTEQARYEEAVEVLTRGLELARAGGRYHNFGGLYTNLGNVQWKLGDVEAATRNYELALEDFEQLYGDEHPVLAVALTNVGNAMSREGRYEDALAAHARALELNERVYGPDHVRNTTPVRNQGLLLARVGRAEEARVFLERGYELRRSWKPLHLRTAKALMDLAWLDRREGKHAEALATAEQVLAQVLELHGEQHAWTARVRAFVGALARELGDLERAHVEGRRAVELFAELRPERDWWWAKALYELALTERARGQLDDAALALGEGEAVATNLYDRQAIRFAMIELRAEVETEGGRGELRAEAEALLAELRAPTEPPYDPHAWAQLSDRVAAWLAEDL